MAHVEQQHFGKPGRRGYHNKEWGKLMKRVGLYPSNTGKPGGKETGQQMTHYVIEGGPFDVACPSLLKRGFSLTWGEAGAVKVGVGADPDDPKKVDKSNRIRFMCKGCAAKAWGKPTLLVMCGRCKLDMMPR